ncbi:hypothetical protein CBM2587_P20034 [Cupriavidus taiwanensis]|uniref:Uncharacterized protein n=1 Tax=Cupriavidus taiwanensis TaxID=164546 RepID=A0A375CJQ0_9BURK|nr:hypothetical protein CBM2587_P20034 [Cupriavidus taiwanensis]
MMTYPDSALLIVQPCVVKEAPMSTICVIAIVPSELLEKLEKRLATVHAPGLTATKVKGYGEYRNFFSSDLTTRAHQDRDLRGGKRRRGHHQSDHRGRTIHRARRRDCGGNRRREVLASTRSPGSVSGYSRMTRIGWCVGCRRG